MTKKILLSAGIGFLALASIGGIVGANAAGLISGDARDAIENNDYNAFVASVDKEVTQEKFDSLVDRYQTKEAINAAIENNDYDQFVSVASDKMLEKVSSQEEFDALVAKTQEKQVLIDNLNNAVIANDYEAYKQEIVNKLESNDESDRNYRDVDVDSAEFDEKLQERFESRVSAYQEDGSLIENFGRNSKKGRSSRKGGR